MKKKPQIKTWSIGMFGYDFGLCLDEESWFKEWDRIDPDNELERRIYPQSYGATTFFARGATKKLTSPLALVTIKPPDNSGMELAAIFCHEAVHIKQEIGRHINEEQMSDEVEAYLVQYIAYGLMDMYKEMAIDHQ